MRKLSLTVIGLYAGILNVFSQDSSQYKIRKLHLEEVNFVSGYYHQNGNHSAVTGGIGTEKLMDIANTFELKYFRYDKKYRKQVLSTEMGFDFYTSASSDMIDPQTISSASSRDGRFYPSASWSINNEQKKKTIAINGSFSKESDYHSFGIGASYEKNSQNNSRSIAINLQTYLDKSFVILPIELRTGFGRGWDYDYPKRSRNSFSASVVFTQVINTRLQLALLAEPAFQKGLLATKFQRVYFSNGALMAENLPGHRLKIPLAIRANYFSGDKIILRSYYRYYQDDWGVKSHTIELETPIKISPFFSISPFYRFYTQTESDYFAPYFEHDPSDIYFTSDYDLSKFNSYYFGSGLRFSNAKNSGGRVRLNSVELRYGHYKRSNGLHSDQLSLYLNYK